MELPGSRKAGSASQRPMLLRAAIRLALLASLILPSFAGALFVSSPAFASGWSGAAAAAWATQNVNTVESNFQGEVDCANFASHALQAGGFPLPGEYVAWVPSLYNWVTGQGGQRVSSVSDLTPGDLIFYHWSTDNGASYYWDHVAVYVGNGNIATHGYISNPYPYGALVAWNAFYNLADEAFVHIPGATSSGDGGNQGAAGADSSISSTSVSGPTGVSSGGGAGTTQSPLLVNALPGQSFQVSANMVNSGSVSWGGSHWGLQLLPNSLGEAPGYAQYLGLGGVVQPNQTQDWVLTIQAPSSPGSYSSEWQMREVTSSPDPWGNNTGPLFGSVLDIQVNVGSGSTNPDPSVGNDSIGQVSLSAPPSGVSASGGAGVIASPFALSAHPGQTFEVSVPMTNTGQSAWGGQNWGLQLVSPYPSNPSVGEAPGYAQYLGLGGVVQPNQTQDWVLTIQAPSSPGTYMSDWEMRHVSGTPNSDGNNTGPVFGPIASISITVLTPPAQPRLVAALAVGNSAIVNWHPPASNGGAPISTYTVTANPGPANVQVPGNTSQAVLNGLEDGTTYDFIVSAQNAIGTSAASQASNGVVPVQVPSAPGQPSATAGNTSAHLTWPAPSSDGGSTISSYTITPYANGTASSPITTSSSATSYTVTGLTNGTSYTFEVVATNAVGTGAASPASNAVTPVAPVPPPVVTSITPSSGPTDGGTSVTIVGSNL
ncbi:MAG: fibronectin type III domain-containing protein, partial [Actinobacteria bacterium]|nr:fibronectin type III domain-containing protein [Actinomycetota bacterium]